MRKLSFIMGVLLSWSSYAESIPGQQLLSYFASNCRTQGEWTRAALADSIALIESLKSIAQDPDCRSMGGAISQLQILNSQLKYLESTNSTKTRLAELNAQEQELLVHLSNTLDANTIKEINKTLRDLQVTRASLIGRTNKEKELIGEDKAAAMASIVQIANSSFSQITANQTCLKKNPSILNSATSIISAVGATTSVVNPVLGLGLTAGASFLGETIEGVRRYQNSRDIRRLSDQTVAFEAYKCALETMSERWCKMRDAETFLLFKATQRSRSIINSSLGTAIRLNDREIPVLLEWLNKIRGGVTPTTTSDATRQGVVFQRETLVRSLEAFGLGLIEENRAIYQSYTNLEERWAFLRSLILSIYPKVETPVRNPLYDVLPVGYAPYFLLGLPDDASIQNPQGYIPIGAWRKPDGFNPTLDVIKEKYIEWISRARTRVNQELTQVLQPDALQTLSSAYDRTGNRWKISPMDSLKALINFLEINRPNERDYAFTKLYNDTLEKLRLIYATTETAVLFEKGNSPSPIEEIYRLAQLEYGSVVIQTRLDMIVRLSLLELLDNSSQEDQILVAQLLAAERFSEAITKMSGTDNLALIRADINRAQPITISNLNNFMTTFGDGINRILSKLLEEEQKSTGTIAKSKRYARTEMCFLLLSVPNAEKTVKTHLCEGVQLKAVVAEGPATETITRNSFRSDFNERACIYREFFRQSKIYENWGIK
jgi:hypothetical protein